MNQIKEKLEKIVAAGRGKEVVEEMVAGTFCAVDWAGGNFDDAFSLGQDVGERLLAEELLKMLEPAAAPGPYTPTPDECRQSDGKAGILPPA